MTVDPGLFLQQNRKFLVAVCLGAAVFLAGEAVVGATVGAKLRLARGILAREGPKARDARYGRRELDQAKARKETAASAFAALRARIEFAPDPRYVLPDGAGANFYLEAVAKTREELKAKGSRAGVEFDDKLGLPPLSPSAREDIRRTLRSLDLVRRIVERGIDARVRAIPEIRPVEARGRRRPGEKGSGGFLDEIRVAAKLVGQPDAIASFLDATQRGERVVPLGAMGAIARNPEREGEVVATIEFAAIEVHEDRDP